MIECRKLRFGYEGGPPILHDIDLVIEEGTYVGVVGANGSGKSTLTKHFNALLLPQAGEVLVDGVSTLEDPGKARGLVGMVLQNPDNQIVGTVVEDDVAFGPENLCLPHDEMVRRVDRALARVGLTACRGRGAETLSGGQKQRLAIAGVLALHPRHVVLDEPTSMLDPVGREEVEACLADLHADGVTVIHVTHLLEELLGADRILALEAGRVVFDGRPRELFRDKKLMSRLKLELPAPAALALALEHQKGIPKDVPWDLEGLLEHLGAGEAPELEEGEPAPPVAPSRQEQDALVRAREVAVDYMKGSPLEVRALADIDFQLLEGELVGLVGATGSGKSTLIQVLARLLTPSHGRVDYREGIDPEQLYRSLGVVFQQPEDQLFEPTVFDDVAYGPRQLGLDPAEVEARVRQSLELLGLPVEAVLTRSPFDLSGGEKRRVAIAGVLSMRPRVLIFDEPTAGLDAEARKLLLECLGRLHREREAAILVVSHDMNLLADLTDRMVMIHEGTVRADASPATLFAMEHGIEAAGLRPPYAVRVLRRLRRRGWDVLTGQATAVDAARAIAEVHRGRRSR